VKVRPDQAYRIRELVYLSDGIEQLQLSELRIYKAWKDFFFQCLCEMEELDLLKSIRTYPLGIISDPDADASDSERDADADADSDAEPEYNVSGSSDQCLNKKEVINMRNDRSAARKSQTMKICPVVHLAAEQTGNQSLSGEQLTKSWREFFLQVLWELQQDGLIKPICTPKSSDHQTSNR
jgi:hypothetical protein